MPQLSFTPENRIGTPNDFPKLKLKVGERKRIVCVEDPTFAYVHTLRAPKIVDGAAIKEEKKRKDGTTYVDYVMDFIGQPICLGDAGILADKGSDPGNCPACAKAAESSEAPAPTRRFAMPVIVYRTRPGGFEVASPFSVDLLVWGFTEGRFSKLVEIAGIVGSLREHDLLLGPCESPEAFQKFDIAYAMSAAYLEDDQRKGLVSETYAQNRPENLEAACGRKISKAFMIDDLRKIADRWQIANGTAHTGARDAAQSDAAALSAGLAGLNAQPATPVDFSTLLGTTPEAPVAEPVTPARRDDPPVDFSALLSQM